MNNIRVHRRTLLQASLAIGVPPSPVWAQMGDVTKLVVPYTPGASNDVIGRMMAEAVAKRSGKNWIVENKPGAGSMLGAELVAKSAPDGKTLLLCGLGNMGILPAIRKSMRYSVDRDFTFLVRIAKSPYALAVNAQLPTSSLAEFVRLSKSKPRGIRVGSAGVGSGDHMGAALLQSQLGLELNIVPYKGMSPVLNDLRAGHIDAAIVTPATVRPLVQDGKVKVLAMLDNQRSELVPNAPSSEELGFPKLKVINWWGIAGPAKLSSETTAALRQILTGVLSDPAFITSLKDKGFEPAVQSGDEFAQFVYADLKAWKALSREANITLDE